MAHPASVPPAAPQRRIGARGWTAVFVAMALIAVWVWFHRSNSGSGPQQERTAGELVRHGDRLCETNSGHPFTGWLVDRYPDSALKSRSQMSNGILQGVSEGWYANGALQLREMFANGVSEGIVTHWCEDGSKLSEGTAHEGKLEGTFRRWHPTGQLAEEVSFRAGAPEGVSHAWHPDGSLKAEVRHQEGKIVDRRFWKPGEKVGQIAAVEGAPAR